MVLNGGKTRLIITPYIEYSQLGNSVEARQATYREL